MAFFYVILSRTLYPLWENPIPSQIYQYIYSFLHKTKNQIHHLPRHDRVVLNAFRFFYGSKLEKCSYAGIAPIHMSFIKYYEIKQIISYDKYACPENIDLHTETWIIDEYEKIKADNKLTEEQKLLIIHQTKLFARNKSVLFLEDN